MKSNVIYGNDMTIWGEFQEDCAGFNIKSLNLPAPWDYIYQNRGILLKMDQRNPSLSGIQISNMTTAGIFRLICSIA